MSTALCVLLGPQPTLLAAQLLRVRGLLRGRRTDPREQRVVELADPVGALPVRTQHLPDLVDVLEPVAERDPVPERQLEVEERIVDHRARLPEAPADVGQRLVARRLVLGLAEARDHARAPHTREPLHPGVAQRTLQLTESVGLELGACDGGLGPPRGAGAGRSLHRATDTLRPARA
jgi:hypothetical protein